MVQLLRQQDLILIFLFPLLSLNFFICVLELFLTKFSLTLVLSLHLDHVVLLVVDLLNSDLLRLYSSLLDLLQDAFLLRLQQVDPVLNLDFIVGELVKAVIDFDHIFLLL